MWLAEDRAPDKPLRHGDLVYIFSDEYWWEPDQPANVYTGSAGGWDPYQKLTIDWDAGPREEFAYAKFRCTGWDIWMIELAGQDAPAVQAEQPSRSAASAPKEPESQKIDEIEQARSEVRSLCAQFADSRNQTEALHVLLLGKLEEYFSKANKAKVELDMKLLAQVQDVLSPSGAKRAPRPASSAAPKSTDGRPGYFTGVNDEAGNRQDHRVQCLAQEDNTCAVRSGYNALLFAGVVKQEDHEDLWRRAAGSLAPKGETFDVLRHAVNNHDGQIERFLADHGGRDVIVLADLDLWNRMLKGTMEPDQRVRRLGAFEEKCKAYARDPGQQEAPALCMVMHTGFNPAMAAEQGGYHFFALRIEAARGKDPGQLSYTYTYRDSKNTPPDRNPLIRWFIDRYLPKKA